MPVESLPSRMGRGQNRQIVDKASAIVEDSNTNGGQSGGTNFDDSTLEDAGEDGMNKVKRMLCLSHTSKYVLVSFLSIISSTIAYYCSP